MQTGEGGPYPVAMTTSAHDVAAELRKQLPGLSKLKLHKLLYFCQGHHLADLEQPLFSETISAWDWGPVVAPLWKEEDELGIRGAQGVLDEAALNTIGYVISRYGSNSGQDLSRITHDQQPWKTADAIRKAEGRPSVRIENTWIKHEFLLEESEDEIRADPQAVLEMVRGAEERLRSESFPSYTREELTTILGRYE